MEEEREATVMKDDGKAIDSATIAKKKVEQREAEESKVPQKKVAVKEEDRKKVEVMENDSKKFEEAVLYHCHPEPTNIFSQNEQKP